MAGRSLLAVATALLGVAGCDSGGGAESCTEVFPEGVTIDAELQDRTCLDDAGSTYIAGWASIDCPDGRTLTWSDHGWGYEGEGLHAFNLGGADHTPPPSVVEYCRNLGG